MNGSRGRPGDRGTWRRLGRERRGATAVEFAFVLPIFAILCFLVFEVGRAFWTRQTMQYAAEETARLAMVAIDKDTTALDSGQESLLTDRFTAQLSTLGGVTPVYTIDTIDDQNYLTVSATVEFQSLVPLVALPTVTLSARSRTPLIRD